MRRLTQVELTVYSLVWPVLFFTSQYDIPSAKVTNARPTIFSGVTNFKSRTIILHATAINAVAITSSTGSELEPKYNRILVNQGINMILW
ncbi:hypothetical protein [Pseudoalteromonas tetraodonis]|uniref:hypothetical protein n=1 Tax=Pseudoalteromonas tetraodonis TaxID=43659 RepID=UPI003EBE9FFD